MKACFSFHKHNIHTRMVSDISFSPSARHCISDTIWSLISYLVLTIITISDLLSIFKIITKKDFLVFHETF